jgi:hypothetical protein
MKNKRSRLQLEILLSIAAGILGVLVSVFNVLFRGELIFERIPSEVLLTTTVSIVLTASLVIYLQSASKFRKRRDSGNETKYIQEIEEKIEKISQSLGTANVSNKKIEDAKKDLSRASKVFDLFHSFRDLKDRLLAEAAGLTFRANINLAIGIVSSALGIYILWSQIIFLNNSSSAATSDWKMLAQLYLAKFSLVLLMEFFSYFFLRLYKHDLGEIKYFQNEVTNIEFKSIAIQIALEEVDDETIKKVVIEFSKTERNLLLKPGESTVELENAKSENEFLKNMLSSIGGLVNKVGGKKK